MNISDPNHPSIPMCDRLARGHRSPRRLVQTDSDEDIAFISSWIRCNGGDVRNARRVLVEHKRQRRARIGA